MRIELNFRHTNRERIVIIHQQCGFIQQARQNSTVRNGKSFQHISHKLDLCSKIRGVSAPSKPLHFTPTKVKFADKQRDLFFSDQGMIHLYTSKRMLSNHNWFLLLQIDDLFSAHTKNIRIRPSLTRTYSRSRCKIRRIRHTQSFMGVSMCFTGHLGVCFIHQRGECGDRLEATSIPNEHWLVG
jgi:hypothetical protein